MSRGGGGATLENNACLPQQRCTRAVRQAAGARVQGDRAAAFLAARMLASRPCI